MRCFLLLLTLAIPAGASSAQDRPNILYIMSDDHAAPAISAYGGFLAKAAPTPNIDRLAAEGMIFRNCFCTNSICTPSRAVIFTGKYSHKNGVYKFTPLDQRQPTLPKQMHTAGYHTGFVGKWHLHSNPVGFDSWSILPGQGRYHDPQFVEMGDEHMSGRVKQGKRTTYKGHSSDVIADKALHYLEKVRPKNQPFMLFCQFKAPHDTWQCAPRYEKLFADIDLPEPATLFDDYATRSAALKKTLQFIGSRWGHHTDFVRQTKDLKGRARKKAQYQMYIKKYLRCVRGVDDNVGRILNYLDSSGLAKNTLVVYTADQGFFLGEHGLYDKRFMYEEALRMPLLIRWPGKIRRGSVNEDLVLNLDFAPTLLEAAGAKALSGAQGRSFGRLLRGDTPADWRTSMYYRYYFSHFQTEPHLGVRTKTHKLIHYHRLGQWELYDLGKDPREVKNVYQDAAYGSVRQQLTAELARLQSKFGDDPQDQGEKPRTGFEK
jgi:arylsulfatase A-like enzyme